ncbi:hypothetical protein DM02DRAFT_127179 [Periconia macrospinosa]|uniref:Uncharacterized protein n=1 Tax=Periconia macrospinosa TaxID=97972 RepID=A0A2V1E464_9PLEO|nr:hypothetical protein DM02DRAFT_127179 [Periconia macrospinosa]
MAQSMWVFVVRPPSIHPYVSQAKTDHIVHPLSSPTKTNTQSKQSGEDDFNIWIVQSSAPRRISRFVIPHLQLHLPSARTHIPNLLYIRTHVRACARVYALAGRTKIKFDIGGNILMILGSNLFARACVIRILGVSADADGEKGGGRIGYVMESCYTAARRRHMCREQSYFSFSFLIFLLCEYARHVLVTSITVPHYLEYADVWRGNGQMDFRLLIRMFSTDTRRKFESLINSMCCIE